MHRETVNVYMCYAEASADVTGYISFLRIFLVLRPNGSGRRLFR